MVTDITKRVKRLINELDLNEKSISERINIPQTTLNSSIKSTRGVSLNVISLILDNFPNVSAEWLLRGEGDIFRHKECSTIANQHVSGNNSGAIISNVAGNNTSSSSDKDTLIKELMDRNQQLMDKIVKIYDKLLEKD